MVTTSSAVSVVPLAEVRAGAFLLRVPEAVLIDCGMRGQGRAIVRALRAAGVGPQDLALIALTHWHIDHTGSLRAIQRQSRALTVAHRADAPIIRGEVPPIKPRLSGEGGKFARWLLPKLYKPGNVDHLVEDGDLLPGSGGLRVVATPGHTAGHVCYYLPEPGILFVGDAIVNRHGELAISPDGFSEEPALARTSLEVLRTLRFQQCYFGHGDPLLERADEQVWSFLDRLAATPATAAEPEPVENATP